MGRDTIGARDDWEGPAEYLGREDAGGQAREEDIVGMAAGPQRQESEKGSHVDEKTVMGEDGGHHDDSTSGKGQMGGGVGWDGSERGRGGVERACESMCQGERGGGGQEDVVREAQRGSGRREEGGSTLNGRGKRWG